MAETDQPDIVSATTACFRQRSRNCALMYREGHSTIQVNIHIDIIPSGCARNRYASETANSIPNFNGVPSFC